MWHVHVVKHRLGTILNNNQGLPKIYTLFTDKRSRLYQNTPTGLQRCAMHVQLVFHCFNFGALVCTLHFSQILWCNDVCQQARAVSEPTYKSWMVCTARAQAFRLVPWSAPCAFLNSVMQRCLPTVSEPTYKSSAVRTARAFLLD